MNKNNRTGGLICRGSWMLGSACGECDRCIEEAKKLIPSLRKENLAWRDAAIKCVHGHDVVISNGGVGWSRHVEEPLWQLRKISGRKEW